MSNHNTIAAATEQLASAPLARPQRIRHFLSAYPPLVLFGILWMLAMVTVALLADLMSP
jgi:hypothetical protein